MTKNDKKKREMAELCKNYNAPTIAKILGVSKRTIYRWKKEMGLANNAIRPRYYLFDYEDELAITNAYLNGRKTNDIATEYDTDNNTIIRICKRHGAAILDSTASLRRSLDSESYSYFNSITPKNSYFIGLICADGSLSGNILTVGLKESDGDLLYRLRRECGIGSISTVANKLNDKEFLLTRLRVCKSRIISDLKELGVESFKDDNPRIIYDLNKSCFHYFIGGFFDGDGILCKSRSQCGFVGTRNVLDTIRSRLLDLGFEFRLYEHGSIHKLITSDKKIMLGFLEWLQPALRLARKKELANKWIKRLSYDLKWLDEFRFVAKNFEDNPSSYRIRAIKEIITHINRFKPLQYTETELIESLSGNCRKIMLHFNPHIWGIRVKGHRTIPEVWNNKNLRKCLNILMNARGVVTTERLIYELQFQTRAKLASLFYPSLAEYIYEYAGVKSSDAIFDPCGGWGGRLIAAYKLGLNYITTELNSNTYDGLIGIKSFIGSDATIYNTSCFDVDTWDADWVITSPPYGDTEDYEVGMFNMNQFFDAIRGKCILHLNKNMAKLCDKIRKPSKVLEIPKRYFYAASKEYLYIYK